MTRSEPRVRVWKASIQLQQEGDSLTESDQFLTVEAEDAGAGLFYTLKTRRWAFDSVEELANQVQAVIDGIAWVEVMIDGLSEQASDPDEQVEDDPCDEEMQQDDAEAAEPIRQVILRDVAMAMRSVHGLPGEGE